VIDKPIVGCVTVFLSDRPGIGRSMAVASVAWLLAANGRRVLAIDWDLAKPSLLKYYAPFCEFESVANGRGIIDFVWDYVRTARRTAAADRVNVAQRTPMPQSWPCRIPEPMQSRSGATLHLIHSGAEVTADLRVRYLNWREMFDRLDGNAVLVGLLNQFRMLYDAVLIDCPAGRVTDEAIAPLLNADQAVACFTQDAESIQTTATLARWVVERSVPRQLRVYPIMLRAESAELELLSKATEYARSAFCWTGYENGVKGARLPTVCELPFLRFQRVLPVLADFADAVRVYEVLASAICPGLPIEWRTARHEELNTYLADYQKHRTVPPFSRPPQPYRGDAPYVFVSYARDDVDRVVPILRELAELGFRLWWDEGIPGGVEWQRYLAGRIEKSQAVLLFVTSRAIQSGYVTDEIRTGFQSGKPFLSIRLDLARFGAECDDILDRYQMVDRSATDFEAQLESSFSALAPEALPE